ncbi:hypothetical protein ACFQFC_16460 [Amorphoplanes digitatis]|uniref:Uncharacterized protein n=1 Tax=Actinoplanes digitatis TaxID=1868 RepID=A0A7W7I3M0_9ACTN|nr:hypothetical protein [Actinoplanes digitatis]MBB4765807.1 hypothetical protein [Actinoplanes digitatis]GID93401.1 hypothetical protein Adi01nite_28130 [Actinoplanes digitatis]
MIDADTYLKGLADRLAGDGCAVTHEELGLVGYKAQFKALSRMHVFLVAAKADRVGEAEVNGFTDAAVRLAVARKGKWSGAQSGVIVLPVLVAAAADESAVALTRRAHRLNLGGFATMAQPAVVDLAAGQVWTFRGTRIWGYAFNSLIKQKYTRYLPEPV